MDLLELGKKAVSESSPAGSDVRYDPEYDELQQEIDKLTSVTAGGPIDWKHVLKLCASILDAKSKDMKVATYLGVALLHLKGIEGFSAGTQILLDLVEGYWDTMYPLKKRMRGRFNAISWWSDCSEKFLNDYDGGDIPKDIVDLLLDRLEKLDGALSDKSEDAPMLNSLSDYVRRLPVQSPAPEVEEHPEDVLQDVPQDGVQDDVPQVEDKVAPAGTSEQSSTPVSFGKINSEDDCNRELEAGLAGLSDVSEYLLSTNLSDSSSYRLRRMVAWIPVRGLPPGDKGSTMIPPPDESIKKSIMSQLKAQDFVGAVQAAEALVGQYLFWIDLSRLTSEALDGLGNEYLDAKLAVELETGFFVKRMSGIESMTFSDGTPFADAGTRSWLKSLNQEKSSGLVSAGEKGSAAGKVLEQAAKLVKGKNVFDAAAIIQDSYNRAPSGVERFRLKLGLIRMLADVDSGQTVFVHVKELLDHIENFRLEEWDLDLALQGLMTAFEALSAMSGDEAAVLSEKTLQRIALLSPAYALKINGLH